MKNSLYGIFLLIVPITFLVGQTDVKIISPHKLVRAVKIPITQQWTATGITILTGDLFTVIVEGFASTGGASNANNFGRMGTEGCGDNIDPNTLLPTVAAYSVIGKIGTNGHPFYVGKNRTLQSNVSGELYFGYNDNPANFWDNYGYYIAFVVHKSLITNSIIEGSNSIPSSPTLSQNYPNPFNPTTTLNII